MAGWQQIQDIIWPNEYQPSQLTNYPCHARLCLIAEKPSFRWETKQLVSNRKERKQL